MEIQVTQFVRPNGSQRERTTIISDDCADNYKLLTGLGLRLTSEVLSTGQVSLCIEHPGIGDVDIRICSNGPQVTSEIESMIKKFNQHEYNEWLTGMN